jgi:hypothetical protein
LSYNRHLGELPGSAHARQPNDRTRGIRSRIETVSSRRSPACEFAGALEELRILGVLIHDPIDVCFRVFSRRMLSLVGEHRIIVDLVDAADALEVMAADGRLSTKTFRDPLNELLLPIWIEFIRLHHAERWSILIIRQSD